MSQVMRKNLPIGCIVIEDQHPQLLQTQQPGFGYRFLAKLLVESAVNQNVEPCPGTLVTPICPPIKSTNCFEMARPNPVPPYLRVVEPSLV